MVYALLLITKLPHKENHLISTLSLNNYLGTNNKLLIGGKVLNFDIFVLKLKHLFGSKSSKF